MRRLLSILLLAACALPVALPLLALAQDDEANLPACCRRNGAHHCMMNMRMLPTDAHRAGMLCPSLPQPTATVAHFALAGLGSPSLTIAPVSHALEVSAKADTQRRISRERSRHKRGPPAALLAA